MTGLLLLVVLLLPGLTYVMVRERVGAERRLSPFRETGGVVFGSVLAELAVLVLFAIVRSLWPAATPDIGRLMRDGTAYVRDDYVLLGWWTVGLLLAASALAALVAVLAGRNQSPHAMSAWWVLFKNWYPEINAHVGCTLDDGSYVAGSQASFNTSSEDSPDRDLILSAPIQYRAAGHAEAILYPASAVCIPARRIVALFVSYPPPEQREPEPELELEQPEPREQEAEEEQVPLAAGQ